MSKYAVLDLEMCKVPKKHKREKRRNEIIEIGAVLLDEDFEVIGEFKTFVAPEEGVIDSYIHALTGISQQDLEGAPELRTALERFVAWLPEDTVVITWSVSDERQIRKETERKGISGLCGFLDGFIDCQADFSSRMDARKAYGLTEALILAGIEYDEHIHDALVDARNTAMLFRKLKMEKTLKLISCFGQRSAGGFSYNPFAELLTG